MSGNEEFLASAATGAGEGIASIAAMACIGAIAMIASIKVDKDGKISFDEKLFEEIYKTLVGAYIAGKLDSFIDDMTANRTMVTKEELKEFGWIDTSDSFEKKLNDALAKYGITDKESIRLFMATMAAESDWGRVKLEEGSDAYFASKGYTKTQRGAGYIQITWKDTHHEFLQSIPDSFPGEDTATYISNQYPMEASAWFWSSVKKIAGKDLNDYVTKNGGSQGIYLITQYYVNGVPGGIGDDLVLIRKGEPFTINENSLSVNGHTYRLPEGWKKREDAYNKAVKAFK